MERILPNVLIAGTPGTGKTTLCQRLAEQRNDLRVINVADFAKENNLYESYDEELECHVLDEDALIDALEPVLTDRNGGIIVDYHGCDLFPREWFDAVFVLRTSNTLLFDRLSQRGYSEKKMTSNVECEIFQTILDEAFDTFDSDIVFERKSESEEDINNNVQFIIDWINKSR